MYRILTTVTRKVKRNHGHFKKCYDPSPTLVRKCASDWQANVYGGRGLEGLYHVELEEVASDTLNRILSTPFSWLVDIILNSPISPLEAA